MNSLTHVHKHELSEELKDIFSQELLEKRRVAAESLVNHSLKLKLWPDRDSIYREIISMTKPEDMEASTEHFLHLKFIEHQLSSALRN